MTTGRTYPARPIVGVGAVILIDGKVVLVKRRFEPRAGEWTLPGGAVEIGEPLEAAVVREIAEETGLQIEVGPVVEVCDRIERDEEGRVRHHYVLVDYLCTAVGGTLKAGSDVAEAALADPNGLDAYRVSAQAAEIISRALRRIDD